MKNEFSFFRPGRQTYFSEKAPTTSETPKVPSKEAQAGNTVRYRAEQALKGMPEGDQKAKIQELLQKSRVAERDEGETKAGRKAKAEELGKKLIESGIAFTTHEEKTIGKGAFVLADAAPKADSDPEFGPPTADKMPKDDAPDKVGSLTETQKAEAELAKLQTEYDEKADVRDDLILQSNILGNESEQLTGSFQKLQIDYVKVNADWNTKIGSLQSSLEASQAELKQLEDTPENDALKAKLQGTIEKTQADIDAAKAAQKKELAELDQKIDAMEEENKEIVDEKDEVDEKLKEVNKEIETIEAEAKKIDAQLDALTQAAPEVPADVQEPSVPESSTGDTTTTTSSGSDGVGGGGSTDTEGSSTESETTGGGGAGGGGSEDSSETETFGGGGAGGGEES